MFEKLSDVFTAIEDEEYVILRNYEEFDNLGFLTCHPDIDILCRNREVLVEKLSLESRRKKEDGIHYKLSVAGAKVAVDLRCVGDGYLDTTWEDNILNNRVKRQNYYVMDEENYFYSLLYHVIIQKDTVAEDYVKRLQSMSEEASISYSFENKEDVLNSYMTDKGYIYCYPEFLGTIFHMERVDQRLVEKNVVKEWKRKVYALYRSMGKRVKTGVVKNG